MLARVKKQMLPVMAAGALSVFALFSWMDKANAETDCAKAELPSEFAICNSEELQILNQTLESRFHHLVTRASSTPVRQAIVKSHDRWLIDRNHCGTDKVCLKLKYKSQLNRLNGASAPAGENNNAV